MIKHLFRCWRYANSIGARNEMIRIQAICLDLQARQDRRPGPPYSRYSRRAQEILGYMMPD